MRKNTKLFFIFLLTTIILLSTISFPINALSDVNIIQDSDNSTSLPSHFRKTTDISKASALKSVNIKGLEELNISGSGQFTPANLHLLLENIDTKLPIIDVDLREESHGFVNDIAISFANSNNSANSGLTLNEIIKKENSDLSSIKLNEPLTLYNNKRTIVPTSVKNESTLTQENNISYIRVPVRDGNLPSKDMVDYFIDVINNTKENTWFHFHCKAGVGRTTTFMIMYDIIKNGNSVSLHDIIGRQVLLSGISPKDSVGFYIGKRYDFLSEFYIKKYKGYKPTLSTIETVNSINCSYSPSIETNDSYIKNNIIPKFLYVISDSNMTKAEQTMIATLQGLISSRSEDQIYILSSTEPDYKIWLKDLNKNYKVKYKIIKDPWKLIDKFKSKVDGYVLYSNVKKHSINNACSLASLKNSIAIDESIEAILNNHGITTLIEDCRETDKYWAFNNLI